MNDDNQDIEARLRRYAPATPSMSGWSAIERRLARRERRVRYASLATVAVLIASVLLHLATARIDRAVAAQAATSAPIDAAALAAALGGGPAAAAFASSVVDTEQPAPPAIAGELP